MARFCDASQAGSFATSPIMDTCILPRQAPGEGPAGLSLRGQEFSESLAMKQDICADKTAECRLVLEKLQDSLLDGRQPVHSPAGVCLRH